MRRRNINAGRVRQSITQSDQSNPASARSSLKSRCSEWRICGVLPGVGKRCAHRCGQSQTSRQLRPHPRHDLPEQSLALEQIVGIVPVETDRSVQTRCWIKQPVPGDRGSIVIVGRLCGIGKRNSVGLSRPCNRIGPAQVVSGATENTESVSFARPGNNATFPQLGGCHILAMPRGREKIPGEIGRMVNMKSFGDRYAGLRRSIVGAGAKIVVIA